MISYTQQQNIFADLAQNNTTSNITRASYLMNIEHRYLLQKYFNNEGSFSISTIGSNSLNLTAAPAIGATSATLAVSWAFPTCNTVVTFSDGETRNVLFTNGSTAITWSVPLVGTQFNLTTAPILGATSATLQTAWSTTTQTSSTAFSDGSTQNVTFTKGSATITWATPLVEAVNAYVNTSINTIAIGVGGVQFYRMPPNYSKLKDVTITVGNLKWTLNEIRTREDWDRLNVFPYYAAIPQSFFIYPGGDHGGMIGIWPIPSTTGNIITYNYKFRVPDLSIADYASTTVTPLGTASVSNGGTVVTGIGTSWIPTTNAANESRWIQFNNVKADGTSAGGDNMWYQIASVDSTTQITLYGAYQGVSVVTSSDYTIGQMPLLPEDFQDMLPWKALVYYFSSIVKDPARANDFEELYKNKLELLSEYSGSNTVQVNLSPRGQGRNPNLFVYKING